METFFLMFVFEWKCVKMFKNSLETLVEGLKIYKQNKCGWHMCVSSFFFTP